MRSRTKIISLVLFLAMMVSVFAGCGSSEEKEVSSNGFAVTLPGNAKENGSESWLHSLLSGWQ